MKGLVVADAAKDDLRDIATYTKRPGAPGRSSAISMNYSSGFGNFVNDRAWADAAVRSAKAIEACVAADI